MASDNDDSRSPPPTYLRQMFIGTSSTPPSRPTGAYLQNGSINRPPRGDDDGPGGGDSARFGGGNDDRHDGSQPADASEPPNAPSVSSTQIGRPAGMRKPKEGKSHVWLLCLVCE